jgi:hypothetical protein
LPNRRVNFHDKHPFGFPSSRGQRNALPLAGFYSAAAAANRRRSSGRLCHRRAHFLSRPKFSLNLHESASSRSHYQMPNAIMLSASDTRARWVNSGFLKKRALALRRIQP